MPKQPWINYSKKLSCKWCFNLKQLRGEVECDIYKWRKICPAGYLIKPNKANTLLGELKKKARKCPHYEGETYIILQEEAHR